MDIIFDGLSRNVTPQEVGLGPTLMCPAATDYAVVHFISVCDPACELSDMTSHNALLRQCTQLL